MLKSVSIFIGTLLAIGSKSFVVAQTPIMEVFGEINGLRGHNIFYCFQDSKYRIWVATDNGVSMWDGQMFKSIETEQGMPEMTVLRISEDTNGNLWFWTMSGLPARFDGKVVTTEWGQDLAKDLNGANFISAFAKVADGSVFFGTHDGRAFRLFPDGHHQLIFSENWGAVQLIEEKDGGYVFHFSKVNTLVKLENGKLTIHPFTQMLEHWTYGTLRTAKLRDGRYVYAVENRIAIVESSGDTLKKVLQITIPVKNVLYVGEDWTRDLWIGTSSGAIQYKAGDHQLLHPIHYLPEYSVSSICRDHERGLWFTTNKDLFHCKNEHILSSSPIVKSLIDESTSIFPSSDGYIYIGFESGRIQKINRKTLEVIEEFPSGTRNRSERIQAFLDGPDQSLLVASYGGLFLIKDHEKKQLASTRVGDFSIYGTEFCACLFSGWVRSKMDSTSQWLTSMSTTLLNAAAQNPTRCLHAAYDRKGTLWVSTYQNLLRVKNDRVDTILTVSGSDAGYKNSVLLATRTNRLLFGTSNHGLYIFAGKQRFLIGKHNGLVDNHIVGVFQDANDFGWVLTSKGISKVSLESTPPVVLGSMGRRNLFGSYNVNHLFVLNDTVWLAAGNGFTRIPTSVALRNQEAPQVFLSELWINNLSRQPIKELELSHKENNVRIRFQPATFSDPQLVEYRYRLIGLTDSFQSTNSQTIDLPGLSPNRYQLEIQARFPFGKWGRSTTILDLIIIAPFWQQFWFVTLVIVLVGLIVFLICWTIIRNIRRKSTLQQALLNARHDALISQMNPHFVFNCLNSIQNFILNHETESANSYLADFATLIRGFLLNGRSVNVSVAEEVKFLKIYLRLESLRLDGKFSFSFDVSKEIVGSSTMLPTMMLQPMIENAIWHGIAPLHDRKGHISVQIALDNEIIKCFIRDNGIGRKAALEKAKNLGRQHQSLASKILDERINLMNFNGGARIEMAIVDLFDESGNNSGTEVALFFPLLIHQPKPHDQNNNR